MKKILLFTLCAILILPAFGQMAGGVSKTYKSSHNSSFEYHRGYKGFVEIGGSVGAHTKSYSEYNSWSDNYDERSNTEMLGSFGVYTSHGYQFSSYIFAGAGLGFEISHETILPLFAEFRCNILNPNRYKYTPFVGLKAGYNLLDKRGLGEGSGFYGHLFIGYRFPLRNSLALNLNAGYQLYVYNKLKGDGGLTTHYDYLDHSFSFRLGFEF